MNKRELLEKLGEYCSECYYESWVDGKSPEPELSADQAYQLIQDLLAYIKTETCMIGCGEKICKCMGVIL